MKKNMRLTFQKGDFIAIALVLLLTFFTAAACLPNTAAAEGAEVQIYQNGILLDTLPLDVNCAVKVTGQYENVVEVRDGSVFISASTCPGGDCIHSGAVSQVGRSIVCLPNRVEVRVIGTNSDVDFVVG